MLAVKGNLINIFHYYIAEATPTSSGAKPIKVTAEKSKAGQVDSYNNLHNRAGGDVKKAVCSLRPEEQI